MENYFGESTPKLGFGLMRLPKKGLSADIRQVETMVDEFLGAGFSYFDTAYVYTGSEAAAKKAIVNRHPRDSYTMASKLNVSIAPTEKAAVNQFATSLKRTGLSYFDYYLLHAIMENNYKKFDKFHLWDFVKEQKEKGLIKHLGFSFHAGPELLNQVLTQHPEVDFVQLQINYADWENPDVTSRANYETARKHGKSIVIMEPVKGGILANPPEKVKELFKAYNPNMSYASWAIRFAASLDGIITVLSGMSDMAQVKDNLSYMKNFQPLNEEEQEIIQKAQKIMGGSKIIPCTACHYCTDGCPKNIPIPEIFAAANKQAVSGQEKQALSDYKKAVKTKGTASDCIGCKQCENACPQHLPIAENLKMCAEKLE